MSYLQHSLIMGLVTYLPRSAIVAFPSQDLEPLILFFFALHAACRADEPDDPGAVTDLLCRRARHVVAAILAWRALALRLPCAAATVWLVEFISKIVGA